MHPHIRTAIYIDGFNLYYRALRERPHCKWLNIHALCRLLLRPNHEIVLLKLFTARVKPRPHDPDQPKRQAMWFRAFRTTPRAQIIEGQYTEHKTRMPAAEDLFDSSGSLVKFPQILRSDEKGSDVNLATHLLSDGFTQLYDAAVVISNDSDLVAPIRVVREIVGRPVGLFLPTNQKKSVELRQAASFHEVIGESHLQRCQFPDMMNDAQGEIRRPESWR